MGQAAGAKLDLDRLIAAMQDARTPIPAELSAQQGGLAALMREIATAGPRELPALRIAVATVVAAIEASAKQASAAQSGQGAAELANASDASRRAVDSALDYTRSLDLQFASADDERAYREREAERRAYIDAQNAKGTPEGHLNAAGATVGQMADAKAHGAHGPEFDKRWDELVATTAQLRATIEREGGDVSQFDKRLRDDFRRILKSKGLSDAQVEARLASHPDNPLEAVKAYVGEGNDVATLEATIQWANKTADDHSTSQAIAKNSLIATDPMAEFRAAGITLAEFAPPSPIVHGVAAQEPIRSVPSGRGIT